MPLFRRRRLFRTRPRRSYSVYRRRRFLRFKAAPKRKGWFRGTRRVNRFGSRRLRLMRQIGVERQYNSASAALEWGTPVLVTIANAYTTTATAYFPRFLNSLQTTLGKRIVSLYQSIKIICPQEMTDEGSQWAYLRFIIIRQKKIGTNEETTPLPQTDPYSPLYQVTDVMEHYTVGGNNNWRIEYDRTFNTTTIRAMPMITLTFGKVREIGFTPTTDTSNLLNVVKNRYWLVVIAQTKTATSPTYLPTVAYNYRMCFSNIGGESIS